MPLRLSLLFLLLLVCDSVTPIVLVAQEDSLSVDQLAFFEQNIRPLLESRCYKCHSGGATELHANLYLDSRPGWEKGGDSGTAIIPGMPEQSLLVQVLRYSDDAPTQMPPEGKLPDKEIQLLTQWIEMGAADPRLEAKKHSKQRIIDLESEKKHWAYQGLLKAVPPTDLELGEPASEWVQNPVDRFILAALQKNAIAPNSRASKAKLIRRLYLDLIGLPPLYSDVEAFEQSTDPNAIEDLIDRLLASSHHGERWGRHWLDVARFAESHGYEQDYDRPNAYHYRDFIIRAFNEDMPYDQFLKWQLAGDELAPADPQALAATGFLAAGVHATQITINQAEKERYDELDDMARTMGTTMLGLTIGCARCHDHKFDPIPNADYYGIVNAFTTTVRSDFDVAVDTEGDRRVLEAYESEHAPIVARLMEFDETVLADRFDLWRRKSTPTVEPLSTWLILEPSVAESQGGATLTKQSDGSFLATGINPDFDVYKFKTKTSLKGITAIRIEALADASMVNKGPGRASNGNIDLTNVTLSVLSAQAPDGPKKVTLINPKATFEQGANLSVAMAIDADPNSGWAIDPQMGKDQAAVFEISQPIVSAEDTDLEIVLEFHGNKQHTIGRVRLSVSTTPSPVPIEVGGEMLIVREKLTALGDHSIATLSPNERTLLLDWYKPGDEERKKLADAVALHESKKPKPSLVTMLICSEGVPAVRLHTQGPDFYEKTFVLKRGDPNQKMDEAESRYVTVLANHQDGASHWHLSPPATSKTSFRRAGLADWVADVEHGAGILASRVIVNRLWQHHFGRGIVSTPSDFGTQGSRPTHPELLDYLAEELIRSGWSLKHIHKLIVMSATYQQSSTSEETKATLDRDNLQVWRFAPRRLEAEIIRDAMLSVSGKLDPTLFGPGTLDMNMNRRSIYFFVKRSQLVPILSLFDAPDTLQDLATRSHTTVAPQALLMMNSPIVRSYAEGLAGQSKPSSDDLISERIRIAYEICLSRKPTDLELQLANEFIIAQSKSYNALGRTDHRELAITDWCQALLSLNEFVFLD